LGFNLRLDETLGMSAEEAVLEAGIGVISVGHRRCEELGLRALAGVMRERWSGLKVFCHPEDEL
jgi:putative NIF3 family GTP cyclohydrolase 1 type 2